MVRVVGGRLDERVVELKAFVPNPLPPDLDLSTFIFDVHADVLEATRELSRLDGIAHSLPDPYLLLFPLLLREAKMSSRIENTVASIEEVAVTGSFPYKAPDEAREIRNYITAMRHGMDSPLPVCKRLILEMHRLLLDGTRGDDKAPGRFRDGQVVIGDESRSPDQARFVPPPPGQTLLDLIDRWEIFVNTKHDALNEIIKIAMAHYQFEAIHPFRDGNGRIGRAIANLSLCKAPTPVISRPLVYVSGFFDKHRQDYYKLLLRVSTNGDWVSWVRFFCRAFVSEAKDSADRIRRLLDLRDDYIKRVSKPKDSASLTRLVDGLFRAPLMRIAEAASLLGVQPRAASRLVGRLQERGILTEITGKDHGRVWAAKELLAIVDRELEPSGD
jgi:Fic family protein